MAVIAVWKCDRDNSMFANKKEAEEYDKMLELAENITALIENNIPDIDEKSSEAIGILLAKHRENLAKACKGKPEVLLDVSEGNTSSGDIAVDDDVVTPIAKGTSKKGAAK